VLGLGECKEKAWWSLLVVENDEKTKWTCLRGAYTLEDDAMFKKVYLSPDLALQERKEPLMELYK